MLLAVGLACVLSSCSLTFDSTRLGVPVTMASAAGAPAEGASFEVSSHAVYGFWGLFKFSQPNLRKALATQLVGGSGVADLRIRVKSGFGDVLISVLTLGIIVPRSVTFEGVVLPAK